MSHDLKGKIHMYHMRNEARRCQHGPQPVERERERDETFIIRDVNGVHKASCLSSYIPSFLPTLTLLTSSPTATTTPAPS